MGPGSPERLGEKPPEIRKAVPGDADAIADLLSTCFADDPVVGMMLPGEGLRRRYFREVFLDTYLDRGLCTVSSGLEGAALWLPPGEKEKAPSAAFGAAWAWGVATRKGIGAFFALQRMAAFVKDRKPSVPHFYLHAVGVKADRRGKGIAKALLAPCLKLCDGTRTLAYLENSKESNVPFYLKLGFEVAEVLDPDKAGARIWLMTREPRVENSPGCNDS